MVKIGQVVSTTKGEMWIIRNYKIERRHEVIEIGGFHTKHRCVVYTEQATITCKEMMIIMIMAMMIKVIDQINRK